MLAAARSRTCATANVNLWLHRGAKDGSDHFNRPKRWKVSRRNANFVSFRTMKLRARLQLN
jgi:hypothetical protein